MSCCNMHYNVALSKRTLTMPVEIRPLNSVLKRSKTLLFRPDFVPKSTSLERQMEYKNLVPLACPACFKHVSW